MSRIQYHLRPWQTATSSTEPRTASETGVSGSAFRAERIGNFCTNLMGVTQGVRSQQRTGYLSSSVCNSLFVLRLTEVATDRLLVVEICPQRVNQSSPVVDCSVAFRESDDRTELICGHG